MQIGANIKIMLEEKGKSQYWLSKTSGISKSYLSELINGKYNNPSIEVVDSIAKALKVPKSNLIENECNVSKHIQDG